MLLHEENAVLSDLAVVCIKWGPKYGFEYANRLASMVRRNLSLPYSFICLTDDPYGLQCSYLPLQPGLSGWWNKLAVFKPEATSLARRVLVLDLDVVITGPLDHLFESSGPLVLTYDWLRPQYLNSACYLLETGSLPQVWTSFTAEVPKKFWGDQEWMTKVVAPDQLSFWPAGWIASYKTHCRKEGRPPNDAKVVCFHGKPKPNECYESWIKEKWQ